MFFLAGLALFALYLAVGPGVAAIKSSGDIEFKQYADKKLFGGPWHGIHGIMNAVRCCTLIVLWPLIFISYARRR